MFHNIEDAISYIYASYEKANKILDWNLPDSQKRNPAFSKDIIQEFPHKPCVLVTGSKGKGSVSNLISQVLQTELKVGLMTSPHVINFTERFKVNGKEITDEEFLNVISKLKPSFDLVESTLSEKEFISPIGYQAAMALLFFLEEQTEFNIFECGKGVQYDDVNNIPHEFAVINPIFLEHTRELGDSLVSIAKDKASIIDGRQKCVYAAAQHPDVMEVIEKRALSYGVPLKKYGHDFWCDNVKVHENGTGFDVYTGKCIYKGLSIKLCGEHQAQNCALAMCICEDILGNIDEEKCKQKLLEWQYPGRLEILSENPLVLLDACINAKSCELVKDYLRVLKANRIIAIVGIPDDKDYVGVVKSIAPLSKEIYLTKSSNAHYIFTKQQQVVLKENGINTIYFEEMREAIEAAKEHSLPICILGTTSLISDVKRMNKEIWNK